LMGVEVHLRAGNRAGEFLHTVGRAALSEFVGVVFRVVRGQIQLLDLKNGIVR
jgi:hypothetical protein